MALPALFAPDAKMARKPETPIQHKAYAAAGAFEAWSTPNSMVISELWIFAKLFTKPDNRWL